MGLRLMAELGLDGSGFEAGFKKAEGVAHSALEGLKGFVLTGIGIGTVEEAIRRTVETANELVSTSRRLAIAPEQLQVLRQAAKNAGTDLDSLTSAFEKLDIAREKALQPGKEGMQSRRAFGAVGVDMTMLRSMSAAQLAMGPLSQAARDRSPEEIGIAFREIFGKGFGPVLATLKTDFDELDKKMHETGAIMDTETAVALKLLAEQFTLLAQIIAAQLGPALVKLVEWIYGTVLNVGKAGAGVGAFENAGAEGMSNWNKTKYTLGYWPMKMGAGFADLVGPLFGKPDAGTKGFVDWQKSLGFDFAKAGMASRTAEKPWEARQQQFQAALEKLAKLAFDLNHPAAADFSHPTLGRVLPRAALLTQGDAMTRVGNFLGGMGISANIEQRKLDYLAQIARNTDRAAREHFLRAGLGLEPWTPLEARMGLNVPHA